MRRKIAATLVMALTVCTSLSADGGSREQRFAAQTQTTKRKVLTTRSWASRHQALLGAIIGAGVGATLAAVDCKRGVSYCRSFGKPADHFFIGLGAVVGGGVGSTAGWIVSRLRR